MLGTKVFMRKINFNLIFRITGFVGGLCSTLVVVDQYLLKTKILSSLSLPVTGVTVSPSTASVRYEPLN